MAPSRTRFGVIIFAVTLGIITYIDRVCISKAAPLIQADLGFTKDQMGQVFAAFTLAYALFEIPGGWLGDKMGPRSVLMRVVSFWSLFTAATGYAWNLGSMLVFRFLFGAGEAGAFPNITKMFTIWLTKKERGMAQGITWLSARWGGALTPLLVLWVLGFMTWRHAFVLFGSMGVVWAIVFYLWFRDNPAHHKGVNAAELELLKDSASNMDSHASIPWSKFLRNPSVLLIWLYYFCISYAWYFYVTWLPTYMEEALHMSAKSGFNAFLAGLPLFLGGIGCFVGGWASNKLSGSLGSLRAARRVVGVVGMTGAGIMLALATVLQNPVLILVAMGLSGFFNDLTIPCAWSACMDVGGKSAGSLSGSMNMMGNLGGALCPVAATFLLNNFNGNWNVPLWVAAGVYVIAMICWLFIDAETPIDQQEPEPV